MPGPESLKLIHDKLGFSYDWLIAGEGEMFDTKDAEIARLTNMILVDGVGDKHGSENIGKAADGQG